MRKRGMIVRHVFSSVIGCMSAYVYKSFWGFIVYAKQAHARCYSQ